MRKLIHLFFASLLLSSCHTQKTDLSLHLEVGKEYKQQTYSKSTVIQDVDGQRISFDMILNGAMTFLVKEEQRGYYEMDVQYDSLSMTIQQSQEAIVFSSEKNDDEDILFTFLAEIKNKPFQIKMTKRGKIKEVKNISVLFESVFHKYPQIPEDQIEKIKAQMMNAYGDDALKGNIEMSTAVYPNKSVDLGDSWIVKTQLQSGMSATIVTTYKFEANNPDCYLIVGKSKIQSADKDAYIQTNGMPLKYDVSGVMSSEIKVDKASGWIFEAKIKQVIQGDAYIKKNPKMPEGMKIPIVLINNMVYSDQ